MIKGKFQCLINPSYLYIYLPTYIPSFIPTLLPTHPSTYLPLYLSSYLPDNLPIYLPTFLSTAVHTNLLMYLPTYLSTYLPTLDLQTRHVWFQHHQQGNLLSTKCPVHIVWRVQQIFTAAIHSRYSQHTH